LSGLRTVVFVVIGVAFLIFGRQFAQLNLRPFVSKQQIAERNKPGHRRLRIAFAWIWATNILVGLFFIFDGVDGMR
jgi:hypothetical protein